MSKNDTTINGLSPVTKKSDGTVTSFPDVCKTPTPGGPVPIPYPNIAKSRDLEKGSKTVFINGGPVCLKGSHFGRSTGDEPGTLGGVISGKTGSKAHPITYSINVKIEGQPVVRNTDLFTSNNRNTLPTPIMQSQPVPALGFTDDEKEKEEKNCPKCGAVWKKTEPTLSQVRMAIKAVSEKHRLEIKELSVNASFGYCGSIAIGEVSNPEKDHFGIEPDIRGECGTKYDVDGFIVDVFAKKIRKFRGKRWAYKNKQTRAIEKNMRKSIKSKNALKYIRSGSNGFSIVLYLPDEENKVIGKGCKMLIN